MRSQFPVEKYPFPPGEDPPPGVRCTVLWSIKPAMKVYLGDIFVLKQG